MLGAGANAASSLDEGCLPSYWSGFVSPEVVRTVDLKERHSRIAELVSRHIVPQIVLAHVTEDRDPASCSQSDVSHLAHLVLGEDSSAAAQLVVELRTRGLAMDTLFLDLLEPAARHLGEMWERDECDFIDVTLGVGRLQALLALFNDTHRIPALFEKRCVFLTMTPGDQHFFGASMVEKFLRAGGWDVHAEEDATLQNIATSVADRWFAVAGLSLGAESRLDGLAEAISVIRRSSRNPAIGIMVGGPTFTHLPELVARVGADATAANAPAAVVAAQKLFEVGALSDWHGSYRM